MESKRSWIDLEPLKRIFLIIGNKASTAEFNLNDLPGSGGRIDLICRFIAQSLFISHGIRRDSAAIAILKGEPDPPKAVFVHGGKVRYMAPDERNIAGLLKKAIRHESKEWKETSPGIFSAKKGLREVLGELKNFRIVYLREDGVDISSIDLEGKLAFVLGDHMGVGRDDEDTITEFAREVMSISPISLQADQCVVVIHNFLDRRTWNGGETGGEWRME